MKPLIRSLWTLALLVGLAVLPSPVLAQPVDPNATVEEEAGSGEPLYGYVGTALLASLAIFILCKSARR